MTGFVSLGFTFGLAAGVIEFMLRWFIADVQGRPSNHDFGLHMVWMIPVSNLLIHGAIGALIAIASVAWDRQRLTRVAFVSLGAASAFGAILHFRNIHIVAGVLLSMGVGVFLGRVLMRRTDRVFAFARRVQWLVVILPAAAIGIRLAEMGAERASRDALPAAETDAPNVLLIVLDAARASSLSAYGYPRRTTPNLEALATRSVLFASAVATAPWTLTSHASMFTARFPHEMTADWDIPLDETYPTVAELFRRRGYLTAGFMANPFYGKPEFGLSRGFDHYESRKITLASVFAAGQLGIRVVEAFNRLTGGYYRPNRMSAGEMNRRLLRWISTSGERPFFVFLNYFDAHEPYVVPAPFDQRFTGAEPKTRSVDRAASAEEFSGLRDAYDQTLAFLDDRLGVLLGELEKRGRLSNTIVIVTSDHGEEFGEHGWAGHGQGLYFPSLHVPLLISFPGRIPQGMVVNDPVTLRDIPATVAALAGVPSSPFPGESLSRYWRPNPDSTATTSPVLSTVSRPRNANPRLPVGRGDMTSIVAGRHQYILNGDGKEELFDVISDPSAKSDLAGRPMARAILDSARVLLVRTGIPTVHRTMPGALLQR